MELGKLIWAAIRAAKDFNDVPLGLPMTAERESLRRACAALKAKTPEA